MKYVFILILFGKKWYNVACMYSIHCIHNMVIIQVEMWNGESVGGIIQEKVVKYWGPENDLLSNIPPGLNNKQIHFCLNRVACRQKVTIVNIISITCINVISCKAVCTNSIVYIKFVVFSHGRHYYLSYRMGKH